MNDFSSFIGKVLDKRYKILELVGVGGMACVLRAQDLLMNRTVAIKILNDEYNGNEQAESRFIDESKAVAMLSHKNIVSIYDVAIYPDIKYIVMEYLDGITLREYLDNKGALPWNEACIYILQVLRALEHAHSKGVIHRDIKPQNIILQKNGEIKVMDFGIAKIPMSADITGGKAVGTVYYISPEQASGKETGAFSDLYSVGILLYEAVTGTLPFKASDPMAVAAMQVNKEPANPRDLVLSIPVGVSQIILKAMMKNPEERFRSAHSMTKAIEWVLRNPDTIFSLSEADSATIGDTSVVSIDMIDTSEIKPYGEDEIAQSLGQRTISDKEKEQKKKEARKERKASRTAKKSTKKPKRHGGTLFPVIMGLFFPFLLVSLVVGITLGVTFVRGLFFSEDESTTASFPNLIGQTYNSELLARLQNGVYGQVFDIPAGVVQYTYNPQFGDGQIIATEPSAYTKKKLDDTAGENPVFKFTSVTVNRLETTTVMPDIVGYSRSDARVLLTNTYGIDSSHIEFAIDTEPDASKYLYENQVTRTYPAAGEPYEAGNTVVVYLSAQQATTKTGAMPDCLGLDAEYASRICGYALYTVELVDLPTFGGDNTVVSQTIDKGTVSNRGTKVTLTVSRPMDGLPNLVGSSLQSALKTLNDMELSYSYVVYEGIPADEPSLNGITDRLTLLLRLDELGGTPTDNTNGAVVLYQNLPAGEMPPEGMDVQLICVRYLPSPDPIQ